MPETQASPSPEHVTCEGPAGVSHWELRVNSQVLQTHRAVIRQCISVLAQALTGQKLAAGGSD